MRLQRVVANRRSGRNSALEMDEVIEGSQRNIAIFPVNVRRKLFLLIIERLLIVSNSRKENCRMDIHVRRFGHARFACRKIVVGRKTFAALMSFGQISDKNVQATGTYRSKHHDHKHLHNVWR